MRDKRELIFQLKKRYTFREIGELLGFSKQYTFQLYWEYRQKVGDNKICDVCEEEKDSVTWQEDKVKVCHDCWKEIKKARRRKYKHS